LQGVIVFGGRERFVLAARTPDIFEALSYCLLGFVECYEFLLNGERYLGPHIPARAKTTGPPFFGHRLCQSLLSRNALWCMPAFAHIEAKGRYAPTTTRLSISRLMQDGAMLLA
jgi:hypothetical protein